MQLAVLFLALGASAFADEPDSTPPSVEVVEPSVTLDLSLDPALALPADVTEPEEGDSAPDDDITPAGPPELELDRAESLETGLSARQHRWLKPRRHLLPQNPYAQTDFTAYTLEWGELKIGLASVNFGILPRTQIGTIPAMYLVGIYNAQAKVNFMRAGPVDLALLGSYYYLPLGDFKGMLGQAGGMVSLRVFDAMTLHAGAQYQWARARGLPTKLPATIGMISGVDQVEAWVAEAEVALNGLPDPTFKGDAINVKVALDYRLNRRDSLVLQASAITWASYDADLALDELGPIPLFEFQSVYSDERQFKVTESYTFSLAWQMSFKQLDVRVGGGWSAIPFAWVLQGNDVSYRMWGKTRLTDTRRKRGWRKNKKDVVATTKPDRKTIRAARKAAEREVSGEPDPIEPEPTPAVHLHDDSESDDADPDLG